MEKLRNSKIVFARRSYLISSILFNSVNGEVVERKAGSFNFDFDSKLVVYHEISLYFSSPGKAVTLAGDYSEVGISDEIKASLNSAVGVALNNKDMWSSFSSPSLVLFYDEKGSVTKTGLFEARKNGKDNYLQIREFKVVDEKNIHILNISENCQQADSFGVQIELNLSQKALGKIENISAE